MLGHWEMKRAMIGRKITEKAIQQLILESLRYRGYFAQRMNSGATAYETKGKRRFLRYGFPGLPDIMVLLPSGQVLFIEVKTEKGLMSQPQTDFKETCDSLGVPHIIARSWGDVEKFLNEYEWGGVNGKTK